MKALRPSLRRVVLASAVLALLASACASPTPAAPIQSAPTATAAAAAATGIAPATPAPGSATPPFSQDLPGPVRLCLEQGLGLAAKNELQNALRAPTAAEQATIDGCLAQLASGGSQPGGSSTQAAGQPAFPAEVPGPVRQCLEQQLGLDVKLQLGNGERAPSAAEQAAIDGCLAQMPSGGSQQGGSAGQAGLQPAFPADVPAPVRQCLEQQLGMDAKQQIGNGERAPSPAEQAAINSCLAQMPAGGSQQGGTSGQASLQPAFPADVPASVRQCLEQQLGMSVKQELGNGNRAASAAEQAAIDGCLAQMGGGPPPAPSEASSAARPYDLAAITAPDALTTQKLGPLEISWYSPLTVSFVENIIHITLRARNTGAQPATLRVLVPSSTIKNQPPWILQVFLFSPAVTLPGSALQADVPVPAGQTVNVVVSASNDTQVEPFTSPDAQMLFTHTLALNLQLVETGERLPVNLDVHMFNSQPGEPVPTLGGTVARPAALSGAVTGPDGQPVSGAVVHLRLFSNMHNEYRAVTDAAGRYTAALPGLDDVAKLMNPDSPALYGPEFAYLAFVDQPGFQLAWKNHIQVNSGQQVSVDFKLAAAPAPLQYQLVGSGGTRDKDFGYWWTLVPASLDSVTVVQAGHPLQPDMPARIVRFDMAGQQLWSFSAARECWGFDVSPDGRYTAAACYDNQLYLLDAQGKLLQKLPHKGYQLAFSPDGKTLLAGAAQDGKAVLYEVPSLKPIWTLDSTGNNALRNVKWSADGQRLALSFGQGLVAEADKSGRLLWTGSIGEYALLLGIDAQYNLFAAGKGRILFSWDAQGRTRWQRHLEMTPENTRLATAADGSYLVSGTTNSELAGYDGQGNILWQKQAPESPAAHMPRGLGHQAYMVTPDGKWTVIGMFDGTVAVLDQAGNTRWSTTAPETGIERDPQSFCLSRTCYGVQSVWISPDGALIAVGYENNVIQIYRRQ